MLEVTGDDCVARTRNLKRSHTLDASAGLEDGADGAGADSRRKRARAAAAFQEPEGGTAVEEPRQLPALADGVACQEEEKEDKPEVDQSTTAIEPPAAAPERPGAVATQLAIEPPEGRVQEESDDPGDASGIGA